MKKLVLLLLMICHISYSQNKPELFVSGALDLKMAIEGPHGEGGVLNPEFTIGFTIPSANVNIWAGYEFLKEIEYQKYTYFAVDHKMDIIRNFETSYGAELSTITRKDIYNEYHTGKYTGPDTSLSVGFNLTISYHITHNIAIFANYNVFTAEKYDNYGNEMKRIRNDVRLGFKIYLFEFS